MLCFLLFSLVSGFFYFVGFFLYTPVILAAGAIMAIISHVLPPRSMALDELHSAAAQATASAPASAPVKAVGIDNGN